MTLRAACLTLAALAATACVGPHVPRAALEGWHSVAVGDVRVVAEASARETELLASHLAGFDAAFAHLLGRRLAAQRPTTIFLIRGRELAGRFGLGSSAAGWAFGTLEASYASVHSRARVETRLTLFHEYTHLLLARQRESRMPRWYNEGLAEYFSTLAVRDGALVVGSVPFERLGWLAASGPMPLDRLFGEVDLTHPKEVGGFYSTAWALVHYRLGTPRGRGELSRFERELAQGVPLDAARERAFGRSFDALAAELSTYIDYLRRGVSASVVLDPSQIQIAEPPAPAPLAAFEVARELGLLALALTEESREEGEEGGLLALSRALLETAVEGDPGNARVRAGLAYARVLSGDAESAAAGIDRALRDASGDAEVLWHAGQIALAGGALDEAEARFRGALALDPRFASAWLGLGRALDRAGDTDAALEALARARSLAWSAALDLEIGRLHLAAGRNDEALAVLQPLARDPHGGRTAERAAELLREADLEPEVGD